MLNYNEISSIFLNHVKDINLPSAKSVKDGTLDEVHFALTVKQVKYGLAKKKKTQTQDALNGIRNTLTHATSLGTCKKGPNNNKPKNIRSVFSLCELSTLRHFFPEALKTKGSFMLHEIMRERNLKS